MTIKSNLYQFSSLCLALLMFLTSIVGVVDIHYCGGHIKSFNFFGKAKACYEMATVKHCPNHPPQKAVATTHNTDKKNCCSNQSFLFQADQDQVSQSASFVISLPTQQVITLSEQKYSLDIICLSNYLLLLRQECLSYLYSSHASLYYSIFS